MSAESIANSALEAGTQLKVATIRRTLQLVVLLLAAGLVASAQAANLPTSWQGTYGYNDNRTPVPFTFSLNVNGSTVSGRITEPATFGNGTSSNLYASLSGSTDGANT